MLKAIIFDFDGTLADSNHLKENAWFEIFSADDHALVRAVLKDIKETRYDILKEIFARKGTPAKKAGSLAQEYAAKYEEAVQNGIALYPQAKDVLKRLGSHFALYLCSLTPESSLAITVRNLGIADLFKGVYGSPATKEENTARILAAEGISAKEALIVGDGGSDKRAAEAAGAVFIGIKNEFNGWEHEPFPLIGNVRELEALLPKLKSLTA